MLSARGNRLKFEHSRPEFRPCDSDGRVLDVVVGQVRNSIYKCQICHLGSPSDYRAASWSGSIRISRQQSVGREGSGRWETQRFYEDKMTQKEQKPVFDGYERL